MTHFSLVRGKNSPSHETMTTWLFAKRSCRPPRHTVCLDKISERFLLRYVKNLYGFILLALDWSSRAAAPKLLCKRLRLVCVVRSLINKEGVTNTRGVWITRGKWYKIRSFKWKYMMLSPSGIKLNCIYRHDKQIFMRFDTFIIHRDTANNTI